MYNYEKFPFISTFQQLYSGAFFSCMIHLVEFFFNSYLSYLFILSIYLFIWQIVLDPSMKDSHSVRHVIKENSRTLWLKHSDKKARIRTFVWVICVLVTLPVICNGWCLGGYLIMFPLTKLWMTNLQKEKKRRMWPYGLLDRWLDECLGCRCL